MRARRARVFREFSPVRGSGPVHVLVGPGCDHLPIQLTNK